MPAITQRKRGETNFFSLLTALILITTLSTLPKTAAKASIKEIQPLRFGTLVLKDNEQPYTLTVPPEGTTTYSDGLALAPDSDPPQSGIYDIQVLSPETRLSIEITATGFIMQQNGENPQKITGNSFTITGFQTIVTNSLETGKTLVKIGATLETSGNGLPYEDGTYTGSMDITINY